MITATDLFCGAGGSSLGAESTGKVRLVMAANHWQTAIDVHQEHFPHAAHDVADISQADPRRYPASDLLIASPECTNHSQARGVSRKRQDPSLWDAPDPAAERSRATMWDVPRFAEQLHYPAIVVENVVEATRWALWPAWWQAMELLGYQGTVVSANSMFHEVPQSRDRIYVVWVKKGLNVNLEQEVDGWCVRCDDWKVCRQAWKPGRHVGRYRRQWNWSCVSCGGEGFPGLRAAAEIIDWSLPTPTIGERTRPLADKTRERIRAGLERYGWIPIVTAGAGNGFERTPGNRARPLTEPLPTQTTTATHSLVMPMRRNGRPWPVSGPVPTVTGGGNHHGLLMRNNNHQGDPGSMVTPVSEPVRTLTTTGAQSLLVPYFSQSKPRPVSEPVGTISTRDHYALLEPDAVIDACGFRMLEPYEAAAAMAFPAGYIPRGLPKKDQVKLAGNAVTPPVMAWLVGRVAQGLEAA